MNDTVLTWLITALLILSAVLRMGLARRKGSAMSAGQKLQVWLFPCAMVIAAALWQAQLADVVIPVLLLGVLEELLLHTAAKRRNQTADLGQPAEKTKDFPE